MTLEPIPGETNGYTMMDGSKRIVIDDRLAPGMLAKVGLHEAAHSALHADDADGEYVRHRGIKETEAKSVTYVSAGLLGLDTSTYSIGYIAGWSDCDPKVIKDTASRVLRCAHMFAEALTESPVSETAHAGPRLDPADLDPSNLNPSRVGVDASVALSL